jgi:hypothetical protein
MDEQGSANGVASQGPAMPCCCAHSICALLLAACQADVRRLAKAEKAKERGNQAFKQTKYR